MFLWVMGSGQKTMACGCVDRTLEPKELGLILDLILEIAVEWLGL